MMSQIFLGTLLFDKYFHHNELSGFFYSGQFSSIAPPKTKILMKIQTFHLKIFI